MLVLRKAENGFVIKNYCEDEPKIFVLENEKPDESIHDVIRLLHTILREMGLGKYMSNEGECKLIIKAEPIICEHTQEVNQ